MSVNHVTRLFPPKKTSSDHLYPALGSCSVPHTAPKRHFKEVICRKTNRREDFRSDGRRESPHWSDRCLIKAVCWVKVRSSSSPLVFVQDLHRTGCSSYCGQEGEQDRVVLKRVLLAYARWNKTVGYCQGFNVLAALILEVTEGNESDALKVHMLTHTHTHSRTLVSSSLSSVFQVMIYLIDKVLPESYFANNLRALSGKHSDTPTSCKNKHVEGPAEHQF